MNIKKPTIPVYFDLDGVHVRLAKDWADSGTTPRQHAAMYGFAGSWKANGVYVTCTRERDINGAMVLVRRHFRDGRPRTRTGPYKASAA